MATTISTATVASDLNATLAALGYDFTVDGTSDVTLDADLKKIGAFPPDQLNKIMEHMNLVVQQRMFATVFTPDKNKWRDFLTNLTEEGFGIEDVYQELLDGVTPYWDGNKTDSEIAQDLVSRAAGDVQKKFHITPFERQFKTTVDSRNYSKVFMRTAMQRFIDYRLGNLSNSAEVYLMQNVIIDIIKQMISDGKIKASETVYDINTESGIRNLIEDAKSAADGMLLPSALYNYDEIISITPSADDIYYLTTPAVKERLKVQSAWGAYNLSEAELNGHFILAPNGTSFGTIDDEEVQLIVLDRRAVVCGIKSWLGSSFFVPNTHYVNHWLTIEGIRGYNTFINAMAFTGEELGKFNPIVPVNLTGEAEIV